MCKLIYQFIYLIVIYIYVFTVLIAFWRLPSHYKEAIYFLP